MAPETASLICTAFAVILMVIIIGRKRPDEGSDLIGWALIIGFVVAVIGVVMPYLPETIHQITVKFYTQMGELAYLQKHSHF